MDSVSVLLIDMFLLCATRPHRAARSSAFHLHLQAASLGMSVPMGSAAVAAGIASGNINVAAPGAFVWICYIRCSAPSRVAAVPH